MNATTRTSTRTALRLVIAGPLAAAAVVTGGFAAHAETPAFDPKPGVIVAEPSDPKPKGPGEIAQPAPKPDPKPDGPGEIANPDGEDDPKPNGPGEITNPEGGGDEPGPQVPGDKAGPNPGDSPEDAPGDVPVDVPADAPADVPAGQGTVQGDSSQDAVAEEVPVPSRIDAGAAGLPVEDEDGMSLVWLLAGGGVVTAAGSVLARRRLGGAAR